MPAARLPPPVLRAKWVEGRREVLACDVCNEVVINLYALPRLTEHYLCARCADRYQLLGVAARVARVAR